MLISVIIPTFNGEQFLERAIDSVKNQNYNTEILICDDCSTDNTILIAEENDCFVFVNKYHVGDPNEGRNMGIKNATGEFIAFLDQDDYWLPGKLEHQINLIKKHDQDMCYSLYIPGNFKVNVEFDTNLYSDLINKYWLNYGAHTSSLLIKNENLPFFRSNFQDFEWMLDLLKNRRSCYSLPFVVRSYHLNNLSKREMWRETQYLTIMKYVNGSKLKRLITASHARFYYKYEDWESARYYFRKSNFSIKNVGYYLTSFIPFVRNWVISVFNVWN